MQQLEPVVYLSPARWRSGRAPSRDCSRRDSPAASHHTGYTAWRVEQLYDAFENETARVGVWLDTTELTPEETVDAILRAAGEGE